MVSHASGIVLRVCRFSCCRLRGGDLAGASDVRQTLGASIDRGNPIWDLTSLVEDMGSWCGSETWSDASLLSGVAVATLATKLINSKHYLRDEICRQFCPTRFRAADSAGSRFHPMDLAVRAVAAHAVLARFDACLTCVRPTGDSIADHRTDMTLPIGDLLAALANAEAVSLNCRMDYRRNWRKSDTGFTDPLFRLVLNEAESRLEMPKGNRLLAKRVRKHMDVFRWLVKLAEPALCRC